MKDWLFGLNRIYLAAVTSIQAICAAIWLVLRIRAGEKISVIGLVVALLLIAAIGAFIFGKRKLWIASVMFVFTMPCVFHTAVSGNIALLPDAPRGSISQLLVQRLSWPNFYKMGYTYFIEGVDDGNVIGLTTSPEKLWTDFFPRVEGFYGTFSPEIYKEFAKTSLASFKKEIVCDILMDFTSHIFAPFTTEFTLLGLSPGSNNGKNYRDFIAGGDFGRFYLHFGYAAFIGLFVLAVISLVIRTKKPTAHATLLCMEGVALIAFYDIFFPLRGFDYMNGAWIILIWGFYLLYAMRDVNADG